MQDTNLIFSDNTDMLPDNVAIYVTANQENCTTMRFDAWTPGLVADDDRSQGRQLG